MKSGSTEARPFAQTLPTPQPKRAAPPLATPKGAATNSPDYRIDLASKKVELPQATPQAISLPVPVAPEVEPLVIGEIKKASAKGLKAANVDGPQIKNGSLKRPAIIFMKGLDLLSSPSRSESGYAGLTRIAEVVEGSRVYGWDQKEEVLSEIRKTHPDYPVVLVGHSLGGDTVVEIAKELDTLEHKFRAVDLLVTLDAVGFDHEIIPPNVKRHLNVFGEGNALLNGGPHVARDEERTQVTNLLSELGHTELDDDRSIQREIVRLVDKALGA